MPAYRDRKQGFGFIYVNIKKLLRQTPQIARQPHIHPQDRTAKAYHFPKPGSPRITPSDE